MKIYPFSVVAFVAAVLLTPHPKKPRGPGTQAVLFGEGIISTQDDEFGPAFSPDGKTCYFTKSSASTISNSVYVICYSRFINNKWSEPQIAKFSGRYKDLNPRFSPDGSRLYFISNRPGGAKTKFDGDIWMVRVNGDSLSEPENIDAPVNSSAWELGCSVTNDGTIYFCSTGTTGNPDIYCSRFVNGQYETPENLGDAVNTPYNESDPFIAPDESYLLFASKGRADAIMGAGADSSYPRSDLYISYHVNGKWTAAKNLGPLVNTAAEETSPSISADGKTFYFTSERNFVTIPMKKKLEYSELQEWLRHTGNGLGDIYQLPASLVIKNDH